VDDRPIYLDHNASTPLADGVLEAMLPWLRGGFGNPSSGHAYGRAGHEAVEGARQQVAQLIGAQPGEIVFTSGGTESNNLALLGAVGDAPRGAMVTSAIEHPAVTNPCRELERRGWRLVRLPVDRAGRVAADAGASLDGSIELVSVMHANNEVGTLQPIAELARWAHSRGARLHTDAAQSVGKLPVQVALLEADYLSIAGHKLGAPKGVGALYVRAGAPLRAILHGASHERGLRPGTENVAGIVGLGAACALAAREGDARAERLRWLRDRLWQRLRAALPGATVNGDPDGGLPNTLSVRVPGRLASSWMAACPGVACSAGSACHDGNDTPSEVLTAMGLSREDALATLRLSVGLSTTPQDIDEGARLLCAAAAAW
jgi:cysteine desulfurase